VNLVKYSKQAYLQRKTRILWFTHFAGAVLYLVCPTQKMRPKTGQRNEKLCGFHRTICSNHNIYAWWKRW
jgi:hypothetical protein